MSCLFGKKCSQSWCRKADFFFNFFLLQNFQNTSKTKSASNFCLNTKVYFRFLAIYSNLNFCVILKNTVLDPMLKKRGKTGRPEFPADRNFPPVKKKGFFKISQNLKLQIIKVLNCKVCIKKLAIFSNENFYSIM